MRHLKQRSQTDSKLGRLNLKIYFLEYTSDRSNRGQASRGCNRQIKWVFTELQSPTLFLSIQKNILNHFHSNLSSAIEPSYALKTCRNETSNIQCDNFVRLEQQNKAVSNYARPTGYAILPKQPRNGYHLNENRTKCTTHLY